MQRGIFIDNNAKAWLSLLEALKDMKPLPEELTEKVNDLIMSINDYVYGDFYDYFKDYDIDFQYCCEDSLKAFNAAIDKL